MADATVDQRRAAEAWHVITIAVVVASLAILVLAHVFVAVGSTTPIFYTDEVGYIGNAQILAGVGSPRNLSASSYYIGWSLFIVPLWWISHDPGTVYIMAVVLSVACGIAVVWPLTNVLRRLGMATPWAIVAAAALAVAPARLVMSNFALAENFIALLVALTVLAALRFAESRSVGRAAVLVAFASYLFITHERTAPVLIATVIWVLVSSIRSFLARGWLTLLVSGLVAVVILVPGLLLYKMTTALMYHEQTVGREERGFGRLFGADLLASVTAGLGQLWYLTAAWYGLALLGLIVVAVRIRSEWKSRRFGAATWAALVFLGTLAVSVIWVATPIARGDTRFDIYTYGRYLDSVLFVLAGVGVAAVATRLTRRMLVAWAIALVAVTALFFLVVYRQVPTAPGTWYGPNSVAGIIQWPWPLVSSATRPPYLIASIAAVAGVVALVLVARFVPRRFTAAAVAVCVLGAFLISGVAAEVRTMRPTFTAWYSSFTLRSEVATVLAEHPKATLSFDTVGLSNSLYGADTVSRNAYQFWLAPRALPVFSSSKREPTTQLVISRKSWPQGDLLGAKLVKDDTGLFDDALWVMPGTLQDQLEAAGELAD